LSLHEQCEAQGSESDWSSATSPSDSDASVRDAVAQQNTVVPDSTSAAAHIPGQNKRPREGEVTV
jgi:hypothetical protein